MDVNARFRANVRMFYAWIGSMLLLGVGPVVGQMLIEGGTTGERVVGVTIAMLAWAPWSYVVFRAVQRGDEFARRVHLVGLAVGFLGIMVVMAALDWLARAEFIETPPLAFVWPIGLVFWLAGILGANRYYQGPA